MHISRLRAEIDGASENIITFARNLVQTPSITGQEKTIAGIIENQMKELEYDDVINDPMGNIIGIVKGRGQGKNIMFNGHMDHVDIGRLELWPYDPFDAIIEDGYIYGRGTCDMKCSIASQIYAAALIKKLGIEHNGDIVVTCVVQEELGIRLGISYMCDVTFPHRGITVDMVVVGEPSNLKLMLGHKGRVELEINTYGRTSHASFPHLGINAVYKMIPVINAIQELDKNFVVNDVFGKSTANLTRISCSPGGNNIIPDVCTLCLDTRLIPGETENYILKPLKEILTKIGKSDSEFKGDAKVAEVKAKSYTGLSQKGKKIMPSWSISSENPDILVIRNALKEISSTEPKLGYWDFATDGGHTAAILKIPTVGYGPGEPELAHTVKERIEIDKLLESTIGNIVIALAIAR